MGALLAALALAAAGVGGPQAETSIHQLTPVQLAGQRIIAGYRGYKPPPELRRRIRRGEVGGVILFRRNVKSRDQVADVIERLQAVPRPHDVDEPLLVMVDQEGGSVVRIPGAPRRSAADVGASGSERAARATGRAAGRTLRAARVNVNLAPVVDVARNGSAMQRERRAYGTDALGTPATAPYGSAAQVAVLAARAGVDLMLYSSYATGEAATRRVARAIRGGRVRRDEAEASLRRLIELRHSLR